MPGQSRHFLHAPAHALTDRCESANALLRFSFQGVLDGSADASVFTQINRLLQEHLSRLSPVRSRMDEAVAMMQQSHGVASIERAAEVFCRSRRQFERVFQEAVGVSPKLVAQISRFQHAAASAVHTASLADLAAKAGYADQSHMAHEFKRFANASPKRFVQENVAFLQGLHSPFAEN